MSVTHFCWQALGGIPYPPPTAKRGRYQYGPDDRCCLCGGATDGLGWPRTSLPDTFTNWNLCAVPSAQTICQPCMALCSGETWKAYVAAHPAMGLKAVHPLSWRSYSHCFTATSHACPQRAQWRALLLDPPPPPFVYVIAESRQKHLLFRAAIAYSREVFPVQMEEDRLIVDRVAFTACLTVFETLYAAGLSKDSILSGRYHPAQLRAVGLTTWRAMEQAIAPWRAAHHDEMRLCHFCAQKEAPHA